MRDLGRRDYESDLEDALLRGRAGGKAEGIVTAEAAAKIKVPAGTADKPFNSQTTE